MVKDSAFILCLLEGFAGNSKRVNILLTIRVLIGDIISYTCMVRVHENAVDCISEVLRN